MPTTSPGPSRRTSTLTSGARLMVNAAVSLTGTFCVAARSSTVVSAAAAPCLTQGRKATLAASVVGGIAAVSGYRLEGPHELPLRRAGAIGAVDRAHGGARLAPGGPGGGHQGSRCAGLQLVGRGDRPGR